MVNDPFLDLFLVVKNPYDLRSHIRFWILPKKITITRFRIRTDKRRTSRLIYKRGRRLIAQVESHRTLSDYDFHTVISKVLGLILLKLIHTSLGENNENEQLTRFENLTLQTLPSLSFLQELLYNRAPGFGKGFWFVFVILCYPSYSKIIWKLAPYN